MTELAVLITGSNLGDREAYLAAASEELAEHVGRIVVSSGVYESEPWGPMGDGGGAFLNQVLVIETVLGPLALLDATQSIERALGRKEKGDCATERIYASRTIDIDILYCGSQTVQTEKLTLPHPSIAQREFVLVPLVEVLPDFRHPLTGRSSAEMLDELRKGGL